MCVLEVYRSVFVIFQCLINLQYFFIRYESNSGGEREIQRTMLELLNQLDGFDSRGDVKVNMIVLCACNEYVLKGKFTSVSAEVCLPSRDQTML